MIKVGIVSDTHGKIDDKLLQFFDGCSMIWHCGDIGTVSVISALETVAPVIAVHGNIDGTETFDVTGERTPRATLTLVIHRKSGERLDVPVICRLDTAEEVSIYEAGGVLQRFAQDFLETSKAA